MNEVFNLIHNVNYKFFSIWIKSSLFEKNTLFNLKGVFCIQKLSLEINGSFHFKQCIVLNWEEKSFTLRVFLLNQNDFLLSALIIKMIGIISFKSCDFCILKRSKSHVEIASKGERFRLQHAVYSMISISTKNCSTENSPQHCLTYLS